MIRGSLGGLSPWRWLLFGLGRLGSRKDALFFAPDLRGARALGAASMAYSTLLIAQLGFKLNGWLAFGLGLIVLGLALRFLSKAERLLALGLVALIYLLVRLAPGLDWLLLLQPVLAGLCLYYLSFHRRALPIDRQLGHLGQHLEGWKAYLPRDPLGHHIARVLVSPAGQTFLLAATPGREVQQYGTAHITWQGTGAETVRDLASHDWGVAGQGQQVLWVIRPPQAQGEYPPTAEQGVSTVIAGAPELAEHLKIWDQMRQNLTDPAPADLGREVETGAADELEALLPPGWELQRNVLLAVGGDADLLLTAPSGERYAVDIKSRTDRMVLDAPQGDRAKSWIEIYGQVEGAARQLRAVPVVWQPRARDVDLSLVGQVWCLRGGAADLLEALDALSGVEEQEAPHEVLGVAQDASPEEIRTAYKALAKQYHPDRVGHLGPEFSAIAERRMKAINAAYQTLMG